MRKVKDRSSINGITANEEISMTEHKKHTIRSAERRMSPQTAELLSDKLGDYQKSEQQHFPVEDKRQVARREHTNGSTPSKRA